ncbi:amidohydrolase family protein [Acuticoccus kandeliae]|uniref:amidohydrolase family protein n=1 Tax=Acuticoccus kandeliae TaxID=2073160 RepID=UPI000D3ED148|nr:amidohydrolase family protein [Acuticoccus kandeliae]
MSASIVRGRQVVTHVVDRHHAHAVDDGAVLVENGIVRAVGPFAEIQAAHPDLPVHGTGNQVVLPGFVNGHHHVGLTPVQLGSPDMPLELWFITRLVCRSVNLYLDTLYSAFEMISSGCTTVQHIHGWIPGTVDKVTAGANEVIRAYEDIGMRVSYSFAVRNQNRLVYMDDTEFVKMLPEELQPPMRNHFARFEMTLDDNMNMFETLRAQHHNKERVGIQLAPANLHWCSDEALERLSDMSERHDVPMHMHLLETAYQKEYARRRGGGTAVDYIDRFKMLGPRMTLGHGVWLNESDIERVAETGTNICHNCSSNFRLRSGVGALNVWEAKGVNTAIGMDEAGINDDRDMLQELRLVLRAHRTPGADDSVPTVPQVLRMATAGGAATTAFRNKIGTLTEGQGADLTLIDWDKLSAPYLDPEMPMLDALVQRAKTDGVDMVMCAGDVIYEGGKFAKMDRAAALEALRQDLTRALTEDEVERRGLSKKLLPHVKDFYDKYFDPGQHEPFYKPSSRV